MWHQKLLQYRQQHAQQPAFWGTCHVNSRSTSCTHTRCIWLPTAAFTSTSCQAIPGTPVRCVSPQIAAAAVQTPVPDGHQTELPLPTDIAAGLSKLPENNPVASQKLPVPTTESSGSPTSSRQPDAGSIYSCSQQQAAQQPTQQQTTSALHRAGKQRQAPVLVKRDSLKTLQSAEQLSNGFLLVDKPVKWTSHDVCFKLKNTLKFLGIKKVGHSGTLDPLATGLLIVATGSGTKFCDSFMAEDKEYSGVLWVGQATPSYDAETAVCEEAPWEHITDEDLELAAQKLTGQIEQIPPMYSAIKMQGQKLYELAVQGQTVERKPRSVTIQSFKVWRPNPTQEPQAVHFHVRCSKGTYIRSLAYDFGKLLGSLAHLRALRREASGQYRVDDAWQLPDLIQALKTLKEIKESSSSSTAVASQLS